MYLLNKIKTWWGTECSNVPDGDWGEECTCHDACYERGGDVKARKKCDTDLKEGLKKRQRPILARIYYRGVRILSSRLVAPLFNFGKQRFNWRG